MIGEDISRVRAAAARLNADTFSAAGHGTEWIIQNQEWIQQAVKEGRVIYDIGISTKRPHRSVFYKVESAVVRDYGRHVRVRWH